MKGIYEAKEIYCSGGKDERRTELFVAAIVLLKHRRRGGRQG